MPDNSKDSVLITGANGFVGSRLCRRLISDGYHVIAGIRKGCDMSLIDDLHLDCRYGDVTEPETLSMMVENIDEIEVGRDGLMIKLDLHSGLLLPQVAGEHGWDRITFLEQTCLKAGLPKNIYKDKAAEIYRFTADVF